MRLALTRISKPNPGWYRGDFHLHTTHSDGRYYPKELVKLAIAEGLDFFAITDHNTIDSFEEFDAMNDFLVIHGIEVTLKEGHWNVFGMHGWQDWMVDICTGSIVTTFKGSANTINEVVSQVARLGLLNSINHPLLEPWAWQDDPTRLEYVHCLELWNDPLWPDNAQCNPETVAMWTSWLNAGHRITAIGGSDFHFLPGDDPKFPGEKPGLPVTYVFAEELSSPAILEGLRQRRAYLSMGPEVKFQAAYDGRVFDIGSDLGCIRGEIQLTARIANPGGAEQAVIIQNGEPVATTMLRSDGGEIHHKDKVDPENPGWYRLEAMSPQGEILAITNPIFSGDWQPPASGNYGDYR
jgi:hypothetical protein